MIKRHTRILIAIVASFAASFAGTLAVQARPVGYNHYDVGDLRAQTPDPVTGGLLLIGGGDRNLDAMKWFFAKAGHGHIVILSAAYGSAAGKEFKQKIGGILSAETFEFTDRAAAYDPKILEALKHADGIFISGGDQSDYVKFWRGTPVAELIDAHVASGKPIAGTSAGLAILGEVLYGCMDSTSLTSDEGLADPFGPRNTIEGDFLHIALLKGILTDTHFKERDRLGRLFAFVAKAQLGRPADATPILGLGVDEGAALAVEPDGSGRIYATDANGGAWLVDGSSLRVPNKPGPLEVTRIHVIGIGHQSIIHLPDGKVENPSFDRYYSVSGGKMAIASDEAVKP
ncbi:cyanophycinase [Asticcacaulis sp. 201]|uniref:cyanophycinase n=1 Tax=Asticcacaulis sp. 201 TaxID=3028787 RepID=UPI0029169EC8|nr:cyanophycinase [Asticcacaulis sp. 201]MDV6332885.1 cyanophycinase [Asticcacaulis sp. 201]